MLKIATYSMHLSPHPLKKKEKKKEGERKEIAKNKRQAVLFP